MNKILIRTAMSLTSAFILLIGFTLPTFAASNSVATSHHSHYTAYYLYTPSLTNNGNPGWAHFTDSNGHASAYTNSNGSTNTAEAVWSFPTKGSCDYSVYVPFQNATATITYGLFQPSLFGEQRVATFTLNQQNAYGFTFIDSSPLSGINQVQFSNNDGQHGTNIGVGVANSLQVACY